MVLLPLRFVKLNLNKVRPMNSNDHSVTLTGSPEVISLLKQLLSLEVVTTLPDNELPALDMQTTSASEVQTTSASEVQTTSASDASQVSVDQKGVPFNPAYCTSSKDKPFLIAPKAKAGQWRKRRGLDAKAFETWYQAELLRVQNTQPTAIYPAATAQPITEPAATPSVNTAAAFGGSQVFEPEVQDGSQLMQWISTMQTQAKLTVPQVTQVFTNENLGVQDLFDPTPAAQIKSNVARIFAALQQWVQP